MDCRACGSEIKENDEACQTCGLPVEKQNVPASSSFSKDQEKHSRLGIASFVLSITFTVLVFLLVGISGYYHASTPGGLNPRSVFAFTVGLLTFGCLFALVIAVSLGIAGIVQRQRTRVFAILGTCIAGFTILIVIALMVIGNMA